MLIEAGELQRLCRASALLRDDPASAATIAEVARTVRMSPFHFTRRFAAVFGTTPSAYRRRPMVQAAWVPPFAGCLGAMAYLPASSFREA